MKKSSTRKFAYFVPSTFATAIYAVSFLLYLL